MRPCCLWPVFFVPQTIPLVWYPLNHPGNDINYLEIKCASDKNGWVEIDYDLARGFNDLDTIRFPISPTKETYTYTFPLPDAPLTALRLLPVNGGGMLTVDHLRIINRREEEIRRYGPEALVPLREIASVNAKGPDGWTISSTPHAKDPAAALTTRAPIIPVGMNHRNFLRCLLSTSYLAFMLWLVIMAVVTAFWKPSGWRDFIRMTGMMALVATPFAFVGNRGLIRNSIHYARYTPPIVLDLAFRLQSERDLASQLFWDTGRGFREQDSVRKNFSPENDNHTLIFPLPDHPLRALRFDPHDLDCIVHISAIQVLDFDHNVIAELSLDSLQAQHAIESLKTANGKLVITTLPDAQDPILVFSPAAVNMINDLRKRLAQRHEEA